MLDWLEKLTSRVYALNLNVPYLRWIQNRNSLRNNIWSLLWLLKSRKWKLFNVSCGARFLLFLYLWKFHCSHLTEGFVKDSLAHIWLLNFLFDSLSLKERSIPSICLTNLGIEVLHLAFFLIHFRLFWREDWYCVLDWTPAQIRVLFQPARSLSTRHALWCTSWLDHTHWSFNSLSGSLILFLINTFIRVDVR